MSNGEGGSRLERLFASLWRRMRGEDQKVGEYFKPFPIFYEPPPLQRKDNKTWISPHGRRGSWWDWSR